MNTLAVTFSSNWRLTIESCLWLQFIPQDSLVTSSNKRGTVREKKIFSSRYSMKRHFVELKWERKFSWSKLICRWESRNEVIGKETINFLEDFSLHSLSKFIFFSQQVDRTSSTTSAIPTSTDLDMIWNETLSQSEPSIQSRPNTFVHRLAPPICHSSSYKVSIGHETVNITEILPPRPSIDRLPTIISNERRRILGQRQGVSVLSLCFMCFVSSSLILIAISMMHLFIRVEMNNEKQFLPIYFPSTHNNSANFFYMFSSPTMTESILGNHHRILRDLAMVICLAIVVLNCFCLLVFSIEIYLGSNLAKVKINSFRYVQEEQI